MAINQRLILPNFKASTVKVLYEFFPYIIYDVYYYALVLLWKCQITTCLTPSLSHQQIQGLESSRFLSRTIGNDNNINNLFNRYSITETIFVSPDIVCSEKNTIIEYYNDSITEMENQKLAKLYPVAVLNKNNISIHFNLRFGKLY
jgi:hypothetical protein